MTTKWCEKFNQGCEMWFMFRDYWILVQNYWKQEDTEEYWDALCNSREVFLKKYPYYFPMKLVFAFMDEQERKQKGLPNKALECFDGQKRRK